ncbi:MAG: DNA mismatch repair endonuclease MutL [Lachnospiraceae bacterium]|jgi:DNA mismatch repair protein MutL
MSKIRVLDKNTIDRIAAGESIERPANIAKELIENSIDSGADAITVEIRNGGISYLRVTDNGCGIDEKDVPLAFVRHATSKITDADDLDSIGTLGFRGEALASISAVARVELITKTANEIAGTRYFIEGGEEKTLESIGSPDGTTVIIRDLFYNIPARAKFLKTPLTEGSRISTFVELLALSNPDISFQFIVNGNLRLSTGGSGSLKDTVYSIFGRLIASELIEVDYRDDYASVSGFVAKPSVSRKNRNFENYFVNGRYVKSNICAKAIEDGFGTRLMQHAYPFSCLMIELDPSKTDINVHPAKMEIRFSDEKQVYDSICNAVMSSLKEKEMIVEVKIDPVKEKPQLSERKRFEPFEKEHRRHEAISPTGKPEPQYSYPVSADKEAAKTEANTSIAAEKRADYGMFTGNVTPVQQTLSFYEEEKSDSPGFLSDEGRAKTRIIGQVFDTYWIAQYDSKMMIIDQHAAHEKVLFENLMKQYRESDVMSQILDPPYVVTLSNKESEIVGLYDEALKGLGFEIEFFGDKQYKISSVPYNLSIADPVMLLMDILESIEVDKNVRDIPLYVNRIATEACKAAVKGGGRLSAAEAGALIDELMTLEDPYHCPHGRPTIIAFSKTEIEKKFKRIL